MGLRFAVSTEITGCFKNDLLCSESLQLKGIDEKWQV